MRDRPLVILHVTESYGGGVAASIDQYVRRLPEHEHHLLAHVRAGDFSDGGEMARFAGAATMTPRFRSARKEILAAVAKIRPDILHVHSSFAGAFVRLSVRSRRSRPIVYTPHGFSFERRDVSWLVRMAFFMAESVLGWNTSLTAACSVREARLSKRLRPCARVEYVPNVVEIAHVPAVDHSNVVVGCGRLSEARDPSFFREVAALLSQGADGLCVRWVGDGDAGYRGALEEAGISVTGWLPRGEVLNAMARAAVYVHTASWDGFPMSILEANALGLAIVARDIPALAGAPALVRSPGEMAKSVLSLVGSESEQHRNRAAWAEFLSKHSPEYQRAALICAYMRARRTSEVAVSPR